MTPQVYLVFLTKPNEGTQLLYVCSNYEEAVKATNEFNENSLTNELKKNSTFNAYGNIITSEAEDNGYKYKIERHEVGKFAFNYGRF